MKYIVDLQQIEWEYGGRWNQLLCYPWVSCDVNSLHHVSSNTPNKMANNGMSFRQHALIEFLVKEEISAAETHERLECAYGSVCMGASSVWRRAEHFKEGNTSIQVEPRSGRPRTASTEHEETVDEIIQDDRHVTVDTTARTTGMGHNPVKEMTESLGYKKDGWNILKKGTRAPKLSLGAVTLEQPQLNTRRQWMRSFKTTGVWLWTQQPEQPEWGTIQ